MSFRLTMTTVATLAEAPACWQWTPCPFGSPVASPRNAGWLMRARLSDEPRSPGRESRAWQPYQTVHTLAADLTYEEVLSGETHHAAFFRLQIEDTVVNGMDYALLDADGKIAEVTI